MRDVPEEMADRIESGAARLCHAWILSRKDGVRLGFTDHDRDLWVEGQWCRASSGWSAGAAEADVGMSPGQTSVAGGLDDAAITEADITAGLYDQAKVVLWRVDWERPQLKVRLWAGSMAGIRREAGSSVADLSGPLAALERGIGRTYGRSCDAVLGDARCGLAPGIVAQKTCDKRWKTCVARFGNGENFRGFPDILGDDFVLMRPSLAGQHDGTSRR